MHKIPDGMHNDTWYKGGDRYNQVINQFLKDCKDAYQKRNVIEFGKKSDNVEEICEKES